MKSPRFWIAVVVAGILLNALDFLVHANLLASYYATIETMRTDTPVGWLVAGDFVQVLVFAMVYDKVASVFGAGVLGGATAGLFLGILVGFPTNHFLFLLLKGLPYSLAWVWTGYTIVWYVVAGVILALVMKKGASTAMA